MSYQLAPSKKIIEDDSTVAWLIIPMGLSMLLSLIACYGFNDKVISKDSAEYVIKQSIQDINANNKDVFLGALLRGKSSVERNCVAEVENKSVAHKYEHISKSYSATCSVIPGISSVKYDYYIPASSHMYLVKEGKQYEVTDKDDKNKLLFNVAPSDKFWDSYSLIWRKGKDCVTTQYVEHPKFELKDKDNNLILTELSADIAFACTIDNKLKTVEIKDVKLFNYKG